MENEERDKAFDVWIFNFEKRLGKTVTSTLRGYLFEAFCSGFIESSIQIVTAVRPCLEMNLELQRLGLKAHDEMKKAAESMNRIIGIDKFNQYKKSNQFD